MALKSAYNYVRENIDSNFDKYVADNVSYGCEEDIEDIIYVEGMDFTYDNYLITTLKKALAVLELQDEMFDNMTN